MGTDCNVYLPPATRVRDVADAMALMLGGHVESKPSSNGSKEPYRFVVGARIEVCTSVPSMVTLAFDLPAAAYDSGWGLNPCYHFEASDSYPVKHCRLLDMKCYAPKIAIAKRLVELFGGAADYNDCDRTAVNIRREPPTWNDGSRYSDKKYLAGRAAIHAVKPLTEAEIKAVEKWDAYGNDWQTGYRRLCESVKANAAIQKARGT